MFSQRTKWKLEENAYTRALRRHRESAKPILDLTISNPTLCGLQYDEAAILAALGNSAAMRYEPDPKGLRSARDAVADYYHEKNPATPLDPERLLLTTGTSEAYSFLFRLLCEPDDEVLVAYPSYPLLDFLAAIEDVKLRPFRLVYDRGWQFDVPALRRAIGPRTRAILVVHPNNPTGHFVKCDETEELGAICRERDLALVVDEVFLDYAFPTATGARRRQGSFVGFSQALTFVLSGLSKTAALPQMKVGWIAGCGTDPLVPQAMARLEVIADTHLSLNAPVQHALPQLLAQRRTLRPQIMARVEANLQQLDEQLAGQKAVTRLEVEGGWCVVLRVPAAQSDEEFAIRLIEERSVIAHPGHFYEFTEEGYLVVSLLTPLAEFAEGVRRLIAEAGGWRQPRG